MIRLAHISDCHLAPLPEVSFAQLLSKRLLGFANWKLGRHKIHNAEILQKICADMLAQKPDHIAVTGDLANLSLPDEFTNARDWLEQLGAAKIISVVPGNHDSYVKNGIGQGFYAWSDYMRSDAQGAEIIKGVKGGKSDLFPYVRILQDGQSKLALIGLSSSVPRLPFIASGALGEEQRARLAGILKALKEKGFFRLILLHHPPLAHQTSKRRALEDADELEHILKTEGAELLLHGHNHKQSDVVLPTATGLLPIIGISSASSSEEREDKIARCNIFEIMKTDKGWHCEMISRGVDPQSGQVIELTRKILL